jgi:hypothetical protein
MGCYNSIVVNAPAEQIWNLLRNFHDLSWSPNVIEKVEIVGDKKASEQGAKRVLNSAFHETLLSIDDDTRTLQYSIDDGPDAVSKERVKGYIGIIQVFPVTENDTAFVLWSSKWETDSGGVEAFCNPIYKALLGDLKSRFS